MKRLDATVHDLRKASQVGDRAHRNTVLGQLLGGAAGRDDLDAQLGQAAGELDDPGLVGYRQERPRNPYLCRGCRPEGAHRCALRVITARLYRSDQHLAGTLGVDADRPRGDQADGLRQQLMLDRMQRLEDLVGVAGAGQLDRSLENHRARVDAAVDEMDGHAEHLHPVVERLLHGLETRERRQERRVDVDHPLGELGQELVREQLHVAGQHHQLGAALGQPVGDRAIARRAVGVAIGRKRARLYAGGIGASERAGARLVGRNRDELDPVASVHGVEQCLQVGAFAGGEDRDVHAACSFSTAASRSEPAAHTSQHVTCGGPTAWSPKCARSAARRHSSPST